MQKGGSFSRAHLLHQPAAIKHATISPHYFCTATSTRSFASAVAAAASSQTLLKPSLDTAMHIDSFPASDDPSSSSSDSKVIELRLKSNHQIPFTPDTTLKEFARALV